MTTVLAVISRALRLYGTLEGQGASPDADDAATALIAFNAMKRAWFGTLIGPRLSNFVLTGTTGQAENGGEYMLPGNNFTLTTPANPRAGSRFGMISAGLSLFSYTHTISHPDAIFTINPPGSGYYGYSGTDNRFWFRGDTGAWLTEADSASLSSTIEFPDAVIAYMPYMLCAVMAAEFSADLTPEVQGGNLEGRQFLAKLYGRRGAAALDKPLGNYAQQLAQQAQG